MEIKSNVKGVDKYITIVGMLSSKLLDNEPFCSLQPKCLQVYAYLLYFRNDVFGHLDEELANKLTFDSDSRRKIAEALKIERIGVSNYTKILKEKGILNEDKKSFNKRYLIPNLSEFTIKFE
ncbi:MAG: hypothetical protein ACRCXT_12620 [Paraclostridium sp.]